MEGFGLEFGLVLEFKIRWVLYFAIYWTRMPWVDLVSIWLGPGCFWTK